MEEHTECAAVVEDDDRPGLPSHASLEVMASDDVLHEEVDEPALLRLLETLDPGDEFAVDEEALLAGNGVDADKRVSGVNRVLTNQAAGGTSVVDHFGGRVSDSQGVKPGGKGGR